MEGTNAYVFGDHRSVWKRLYPSPVEGEPLFARCGIPEQADGASSEQAQRLRDAVACLTRASGGSVFVNKRITNNRRIPLLEAAFPTARYVEVVRDGRAVAFSLSRVEWWPDALLWWCGVTPTEWERNGGDPWELCARAWVEEVQAARKGLAVVDSHRVFRVRYEDLVADPGKVIGDVAMFAGLGRDGAWETELGRLSFPNRNEAWRQQLPSAARCAIEGVQGELLAALGYC